LKKGKSEKRRGEKEIEILKGKKAKTNINTVVK
jgi:hypothetical protein